MSAGPWAENFLLDPSGHGWVKSPAGPGNSPVSSSISSLSFPPSLPWMRNQVKKQTRVFCLYEATALSFWEGGRRQYLCDRADEVGLTLGHNHILITSFCSISLSVGWKTIYREKGKLLSLGGPTLCQGQELMEGRRLMVSQGLLGGGQPC